MMVRVSFSSLGLVTTFALLAALGACAAPAPPPAGPAQPAATETAAPPAKVEEIPREAVESGKACAKAESQCGGGVCTVAMDNTCEQAITCSIFVLTICEAETDLVQVKARSREAFAARSKDKVSLTANCESGRIVSTKLQTVECK